MTKEREYERLKASLIKAYTGYITALKHSRFQDLPLPAKRLVFSDEYIQMARANVVFNDFIRKYMKREPQPVRKD